MQIASINDSPQTEIIQQTANFKEFESNCFDKEEECDRSK